jgi:MinD-like ATPase involved in chromosome partitioning or flagellar assembly
MTLRVATVLSARDWESRLVAQARSSASVRLVLRAFRPTEISDRAAAIDVVVVGSETPWATPARLGSWRRLGLRIVGVHPVGDRAAADRLRASSLDLTLADDLDAETMVREIRLLEPAAARGEGTAPLTVVTGGRGAPGRTEVAVAVAWIRASVAPIALVDADLGAPGIALRLGIPPRPDLADAVDQVHATGMVPSALIHHVGRLRVVTGAHRPGEPPLRPEPVFDVVDALRASTPVVVDTGPWPDGEDITKTADEAVVVVDGSPTGVVRAAGVIAGWTGPPPRLVVNRVDPGDRDEVLRSVRRWTGLEPAAVIPVSKTIRMAARRGGPPARSILKALRVFRRLRVAA